MSTMVSRRGRGPTSRTTSDSLDRRLAARIHVERQERRWSLADLAERSGVSRGMIAKIERGTARPTASLLGRLSAAFGLPLSALFSRVETQRERVARASDQPTWTDPTSGYLRRSLSPSGTDPLQLTHIRLPAGARVSYPAEAFAFVHEQIWVLQGTLTFQEGAVVHMLRAGDCLALGPPAKCIFANTTRRECVYLVAVARR